jgi:hypothetical protein
MEGKLEDVEQGVLLPSSPSRESQSGLHANCLFQPIERKLELSDLASSLHKDGSSIGEHANCLSQQMEGKLREAEQVVLLPSSPSREAQSGLHANCLCQPIEGKLELSELASSPQKEVLKGTFSLHSPRVQSPLLSVLCKKSLWPCRTSSIGNLNL